MRAVNSIVHCILFLQRLYKVADGDTGLVTWNGQGWTEFTSAAGMIHRHPEMMEKVLGATSLVQVFLPKINIDIRYKKGVTGEGSIERTGA